ncbi:hypothetical protein MHYP_G00075860 [Metynnis hypsauchen]
MCPQQRARHLAYAEPSKEVKGWMAAAKQRVRARPAQERTESEKNPQHDSDSKLHQDVLIGQLKAEEARSRIRQKRLHEQNLRAQEIKLMISCQPNAHSALRLQRLLLPQERKMNSTDTLNQQQRQRVEEILKDEKGLTMIRR